jgi:hypothetical protein
MRQACLSGTTSYGKYKTSSKSIQNEFLKAKNCSYRDKMLIPFEIQSFKAYTLAPVLGSPLKLSVSNCKQAVCGNAFTCFHISSFAFQGCVSSENRITVEPYLVELESCLTLVFSLKFPQTLDYNVMVN